MGHVERLAHEAQVHPELQKAAAQQAAAEALREAKKQIQKTDKSEGGKINPDAEKKREEPGGEGHPKKEAKGEEHEETHKGAPWSGNLLDVKI